MRTATPTCGNIMESNMLDFVSGNEVFTHPGQDQMQVEVILASKPAQDTGAKPIYTIRMRYPRIIHAEAETHRVFSLNGRVVEEIDPGYGIMSDNDLSRNARSSRAVPVKTMLMECTSIPFIPWHWGKNQKGMQAGESCNEPVILDEYPNYFDFDTPVGRETAWLYARDRAVEVAEAMMTAGYHKQIPNRLLEPFSWIDVLITSCDWDNFLWLRDHKDAEPHLQDLARLVKQAIDAAEVQELEPGEWHSPYVSKEETNGIYQHLKKNRITRDLPSGAEVQATINKISAARCARISYKPFNGDGSYEAELDRYDSLVTADRVHASPLEHQATPDTQMYVFKEFYNNDSEPNPFEDYGEHDWRNPEQHGNLTGYIQARKLVPNERYEG